MTLKLQLYCSIKGALSEEGCRSTGKCKYSNTQRCKYSYKRRKEFKKVTFQLDVDLQKRLRTFAAMNDTTMVEIVEKALNDYMDKNE
ncbi:hypothetical protein [Metabacillus sediminilitoris]|uniref:Ribbon-helix-helix protein CopG domain-containing protein n=1 Tax=Metabacillus sediminilitoris TaxID=2567941 RepID=A0A4S4BNE9_9BACI|nr:hypothetical protein [Metabacillus sediminilitoris]QGQ48299.1 hypothetical protein GMB29_25345 [Metabacillus sediminilitoris]THF74034.1 hypothetical protein E6W99_25830 [Metabacillus sediminilitoris]